VARVNISASLISVFYDNILFVFLLLGPQTYGSNGPYAEFVRFVRTIAQYFANHGESKGNIEKRL